MRIYLESDYLYMEKNTWTVNEENLARSLGIIIRDGRAVANLCHINKKALHIFLRECFGSFFELPEYEQQRNVLFEQLKSKYKEINLYIQKQLKESLTYYNELYDYQKDSIYQMMLRKDNILALDQGLGKTLCAASVSVADGYDYTLIICPAICKYVWYYELIKWGIPESDIQIISAQSKFKGFRKYSIINYDIVNKFNFQIVNFYSGKQVHLILDECYFIKSRSAERSKAVKRVIQIIKPKLSFLSGTPIKNKVIDIFSYLSLCGHNLGKNYTKFVEDYTHYMDTRWGRTIICGKNLKDLAKHLSNIVIRVRKEDVLKLPEKIITKYYFDLEEYKKDYDSAISEAVDKLCKKSFEIESSIHRINRILAVSKIKSISELINGLIYNERKVVVFTSYTDPLNEIYNRFKDMAVYIDGSVNEKTRQQNIEQFQNNPNIKLFVGNIQSSGIGISLTAAQDVIFMNFPFTVAELMQCESRLHRIGQPNTVNVYYTICRDTIEEDIFKELSSKAFDINKVIEEDRNEELKYGNIKEDLFKNVLQRYAGIEVN